MVKINNVTAIDLVYIQSFEMVKYIINSLH